MKETARKSTKNTKKKIRGAEAALNEREEWKRAHSHTNVVLIKLIGKYKTNTETQTAQNERKTKSFNLWN